MNPANKAAKSAAEPGRGTKGNADQQSTLRTQGRVRVTQALDRVRQVAKQTKKEKSPRSYTTSMSTRSGWRFTGSGERQHLGWTA